MKQLVYLVLFSHLSAAASVRPTLVCHNGAGTTLSSMQNLNLGQLRRNGCLENFMSGNICFRGDRGGAINVLLEAESYDFFSPLRLDRVVEYGRSQISYSLVSQDSGHATGPRRIGPCR